MRSKAEDLKTVYHGTSTEQWSKDFLNPPDLYVTQDLNLAIQYAKEWLDADHSPLVLSFDISRLAIHNLKFIPNGETLQQYLDGDCNELAGDSGLKPINQITWKDTLEFNGTFAIQSFPNKLKGIAQTIDPRTWDQPISPLRNFKQSGF